MGNFRSAAVLETDPAAGRQSQSGRQYIYAIVAASTPEITGMAGIGGSPLNVIVEGRAAAVVSGLEVARIRPERRNLAVHQNVLKALMDLSSIPLPMSFGIMAGSPEEVRGMLARNQTAILDQLTRVAGKVEMGLRVKWDVPNIFEYFVDTHPDLRDMRDRIVSNRRMPTQEEKIEMGSLFDRTLNQDRTQFTEQVRALLSPVCSELKVNPCKDEYEVMNIAGLIRRECQEDFSQAVFEAARLFDNQFSFDYSGPFAPHNFVSLDLA